MKHLTHCLSSKAEALSKENYRISWHFSLIKIESLKFWHFSQPMSNTDLLWNANYKIVSYNWLWKLALTIADFKSSSDVVPKNIYKKKKKEYIQWKRIWRFLILIKR